MLPAFPDFKPIALEDRDTIAESLRRYNPQTSELTFTNLFIWRSHFNTSCCQLENWLVVLCEPQSSTPFFLPPIGPPDRTAVATRLLEWLGDTKGAEPSIRRADARLISEIGSDGPFYAEPQRDQFDYVYRSEKLATLGGRKLHSKRSQLNKFLRTCDYIYAPIDGDNRWACMELLSGWCSFRNCRENPSIKAECEASHEALYNFEQLGLTGGAIAVDGRIQAFAIGEMLNSETAVIHIEKADPDIPGLYAAINQQFCENAWGEVTFLNREQDLGEPGLRKAKLSYQPETLVEKYTIRLCGE